MAIDEDIVCAPYKRMDFDCCVYYFIRQTVLKLFWEIFMVTGYLKRIAA